MRWIIYEEFLMFMWMKLFCERTHTMQFRWINNVSSENDFPAHAPWWDGIEICSEVRRVWHYVWIYVGIILEHVVDIIHINTVYKLHHYDTVYEHLRSVSKNSFYTVKNLHFHFFLMPVCWTSYCTEQLAHSTAGKIPGFILTLFRLHCVAVTLSIHWYISHSHFEINCTLLTVLCFSLCTSVVSIIFTLINVH